MLYSFIIEKAVRNIKSDKIIIYYLKYECIRLPEKNSGSFLYKNQHNIRIKTKQAIW